MRIGILLVLLTACTTPHTTTLAATAERVIPFTATSLKTIYGIQGQFQGTATLRDAWLYVTIPTGAVKTYQLDPQQYWDLRLRVGVASCDTTPGRYSSQVVAESRAMRIAPALGIAEQSGPGAVDTTTHSLKEPLRFEVGVPPGTRLERSWIVLLLEWPFNNVLADYSLETDASLAPNGNGPRRVGPPGSDPRTHTFSCR